ncbi:hypothetical protein ACPWSR_02245 [Alloiococcus sp. CFN-8]|uniref:hypothetical protein n=1 Tax=Alloiococcus sp. CFN-8 TaxID=3416081 RepID=UPI003CF305B9
MDKRETITINTTVNAPIENVWKCFNEPEHIRRWNNASEDWHTPSIELQRAGWQSILGNFKRYTEGAN